MAEVCWCKGLADVASKSKLHGVQGVVSSNPTVPTILLK